MLQSLSKVVEMYQSAKLDDLEAYEERCRQVLAESAQTEAELFKQRFGLDLFEEVGGV